MRKSRFLDFADRTALSRRAVLAAGVAGGAAVGLIGASPVAAQTAPVAARHNIVILIDSDDEKVMGHAISYTMNLSRSYADRRDGAKIEVVANGSGITIFRADTSPLKQPLELVRRAVPDVVFSMCDSSRQLAEQKEGRPIGLIPGARLVPFGIQRLVELQEAGWSYIHG